MHLLLTALGSYGDVHPMLGLGAAMRERGHRVTVITNPYFTDEVARAGLEMVSVSSREEYAEVTSHPDIWRPRRSLSLVFRWSVERLLRPVYAALAEHYQPGETVVAAHGLDLASRCFAETQGAPTVSVVYAPLAFASRQEPPRMADAPVGPGWPSWWNRAAFHLGDRLLLRTIVNPELNTFRRELKLPPIKRGFLDWCYGTGHTLALFPEWFAEPQNDWPAGVAAVGFPQWDGSDRAINEELESFLTAGTPPIAFTPGSANRAAEKFFAAAVGACERLKRRGILLTKYPEQLPANLPASVQHFGFVPLSQVLPRSATFVHHGGIGSSAQGLAAGVPQLIHPMAYDQPDNAERLIRLGVADQLPPHKFTAQRVAVKLAELLNSAETQQRCQTFATQCNGIAARERACDYFESLAQ